MGERERKRERERGSERLWREWRRRDKKRDIHSSLANQREGEEGCVRVRRRRRRGDFKRVPGPERKSERKAGMEMNQWRGETVEGNNVHLRFGWKSSRRRSGHRDRLISTVRPFVFHFRLRQRAVLHRLCVLSSFSAELIHRSAQSHTG